MSGIEVAGIVLGMLPVTIKAVKGYMDILSSVKDARRNLKFLLQDLETEHIRLETTCEVLLDGVVPPSSIDRLIRAPLGPEWRLYSDRLRLRLWTRSQKFEEQVGEMQRAVNELRAKLCIECDGSTKLTDRLAIMRELKRGVSFTLKRKDYEETLTRIKTANSILHDLVDRHRGLEPSRKHRSQARLIELMRLLTRSIFNGLRAASSSCCCPRSHDVCLELESRNAVIIPGDDENQVAKKFSFHVVFATETTHRLESSGKLEMRWESIDIKFAGPDNNPVDENAASTSTISPDLDKKSRRVGWTRALSFKTAKEAISARSTSSLASTQTITEVPPALTVALSPSPTGIVELCRLIQNPMQPNTNCYGHIWDGMERKFELRPLETSPPCDARSVITLREVLAGQKNAILPPFQYPERLRVAVALAVNVLHLYQTPWLASIVTLDDVRFLHDKDGKFTYQPFVIKNLKEQHGSPSLDSIGGSTARPVNLTVLSLGALLIQVVTGKIVDSLDMTSGTGTLDMESILTKYEAGSRLNGEVLTCGGINFAEVVKWCLGAVLEVAGFDNDGFCQKFYGAVVVKLEEDAMLLSTAG